jgi:6-phosphogluconate dehydrogenase (decarboxylating)
MAGVVVFDWGMRMNRKEALAIVWQLPEEVRDAIAMAVETADVQGDWHWDGENSNYEDDVQQTLNCLAKEIRTPQPTGADAQQKQGRDGG